MANDFSNVMPKILAQGLLVLRESAVFPRLVNPGYGAEAAQKGNVINIPIAAAIAARSVTPGVNFATNVDTTPTNVQVTLDRWMEAPFQLSDKDFEEADGMIFPMNASAAVKSLGNDIDAFIWGKHVGFFSAVGAAGTTPFASGVTNANSARTKLNQQLCPPDLRRAVLDPSAEGNLLGTTNVLQFDQRGDQQGLISGTIGTKLGFDWYMDQNIGTYSVGGAHANGSVGGWALSGANAVAGVFTITIVHASATGTIKAGDIFTVGGATQQYVVTANATITVTASERSVNFYPALATTAASAIAVTFIATNYVANLAFHRDAILWASRPLGGLAGAGNIFSLPTDPITGVALRLEQSRQYKQDTWSFDYLGGARVIRPELGTKIMG